MEGFIAFIVILLAAAFVAGFLGLFTGRPGRD
jgi:hypothetical protein